MTNPTLVLRFLRAAVLSIILTGIASAAVRDVYPVRDPAWSQSLNGRWQFRYEAGKMKEESARFNAPDFDASKWATIPVPSHWELQGHGEPKYYTPDEGTGYYRRTLAVPAEWAGRRVCLRFDGVLYGCEVWVNGTAVGQWTSGFNPVTFDITDALRRDGSENILAVRVSTRSYGFDFDTNDDWALSGIYRDVTLFAAPATHLQDFTARTTLGADGTAQLAIAVSASGPATVAARLLASDGKPLGSAEIPVDASGRGQAALRIEQPQLWTAETPWLHTLELDLTASGATERTQKIAEKIGLREVSIRDGVLLLNGRPIKLRGVNHHDLEPDTGRVLSEEQLRRDLALIQQANINFVRTSHYPSHPRLIELCDELGLYVMCEVSFGFGDSKLTNPEYQETLLTRARATVRRDHNRPSVIVWSVGNENPITPIMLETGREVQRLDPSRPMCFPTVGSYFDRHYQEFPEWVDIYAPHYPNVARLKHYDAELKRPVIVSEYAHAFGLATDLIQDEWAIMQASRHIAGGAVWHFHDQALLRKAEEPLAPGASSIFTWVDSRHYYDTGGNNGMDGLVYADRRPQTDFWQVRKVYSPVRIAERALKVAPGRKELRLQIANRFDFRSLAGMRIEWAVSRNGVTDQTGAHRLSAAARGEETAVLPIALPAAAGHAVWALEARVVDEHGGEITSRTLALEAGGDRAGALASAFASAKPLGAGGGMNDVLIASTAEGWTVTHARFGLRVARATGHCTVVDSTGVVLAEGFGPHVGRRLTAAESIRPKTTSIWKGTLLTNPVAMEVKVEPAGSGGAQVIVRGKYPRGDEPDQFIEGSCTLSLDAAGRIDVAYDYVPVQGKGTLLEAGLSIVVPRASEFRWVGQGPFAGYPGKDELNEFGVFHLTRDDFRFQGNRRGVETAVLSRPSGAGLAVTGSSMDVAVEATGEVVRLSHNAVISGRGNKALNPTMLIRAEDNPRIAGRFTLYPLSGAEAWPAPLRDWLGSPNRPAPVVERPYYRSYDQ